MDIEYSRHEVRGEIQLLIAKKEVKKLGTGGYALLPKTLIGEGVLIIYAKNKKDLPKIFDDLKKKLEKEKKK
jgi:putative transposon-encoded protein